MKALEVSIDGKVIGLFVPPRGSTFAAMIGNIPRRYMRAQIMSGNETESWQWQLPDVKSGQQISFRMVEAKKGSGTPPHFVRPRQPTEVSETKRLATEAYAKAMKDRSSQVSKPSPRIRKDRKKPKR